jgi:hypothetical protein
MEKIRNGFIIVSLVFAFSSCGEIETLPEIPKIEFTSFTVFDTIDILGNSAKGGRLKFYFEDGDGNIGLPTPVPGQESDSLNLFFSLLRKEDGELAPAPDNDPLKPSAYRIPYMERTGQNTILQGTIAVTFLYNFFSEEDTIRYEFYLKDRAENLSNTVSTNDIVLSVNAVYE